MRPADFICRLHASLKGRYKEHNIAHGLPLGSKLPPTKRKRQALELNEEQWAKRLATPTKSKYYSVPVIMPVPKKMKNKNLHRRHMKSVIQSKQNTNVQDLPKPNPSKESDACKVAIQQSDSKKKV